MFQQALRKDSTNKMVIPTGRFWVVGSISLYVVGLSHRGSRCDFHAAAVIRQPYRPLFVFQSIKIQWIIFDKINRFGDFGVHHLIDADEFHLLAVGGDELLDDG